MPVIGVVLKGYPRLSETFIAQELRALERRGYRLRLYSMRHPTDEKVHPVHQEMRSPVIYLPEFLHHEARRVATAFGKCLFMPAFYGTALGWIGDLGRDRSRSRVRRFGQACVLAAELPDEVGMLYGHFIHTPTAVTRYAARMRGRVWSCSAHAKDIWTSPDWELRQNVRQAVWVATCTAVGFERLAGLADQRNKVQLIYHGLDLDRFPAPPAATEQSARTGALADEPIRLLSVGRAVRKKGFDLLLDALACLPPDLHWSWTHIGAGGELAALKARAVASGLDSRITWAGAQDQTAVIDAYRQSDLFVLPCRITEDGDRDGLPNVLVEAQSQALTCVTTTVSAIPEFIVSGETGILVPPEDVSALADAIAGLAGAPGRRAKMGRAGAARVRASFDMSRGIDALDTLFRRTLSGATDKASLAAVPQDAESGTG